MENSHCDEISSQEKVSLTKQNPIRHVNSHPSMASVFPGSGSRSLGSIPNTNIVANSSSNGQGMNIIFCIYSLLLIEFDSLLSTSAELNSLAYFASLFVLTRSSYDPDLAQLVK